MRKLFLKVYLPLAICVVMTLVISVVAMLRIIPAQIQSHRESVERFREIIGAEGLRDRQALEAVADSLDLDIFLAPRTLHQPSRPPEGYFGLPGVPPDYPWRISISSGPRGGPAGQVRAALWLIIILLLITEGLVLFVALWPVRRRLSRLRWAATEFGAGNLGMKLQVKRKGDLIDDLGRTFNNMGDKIKSLLDSHRELLGIVAHELRTPMARMRLALELIREDSSEESSSKIERMEKDLVALDDLVTELLNYNRLSRESAGSFEEVDLREICEVLANSETWERNDLEVTIQGRSRCSGDPALIARAVGNLVRNAVRHAESRIRLTLDKDADGSVSVTVEDDGPGYSSSVMDRLGEPFVKGPDGGTGLGLAITGRIAALHGGSLEFGSSRELGGARAVLRLS